MLKIKSGIIGMGLLITGFLQGFTAQAQDHTDLMAAEDSLRYYLDSMRKTDTDARKLYWNIKFKKLLSSTLMMPGAFDYAFDKLNSIGKLKSPDNKFRIYNWNIENKDFTQNYYALVQIPANKKKDQVIELLDKSAGIDAPESKALDQLRWYGCLYYKIILTNENGNGVYTLLGFDMNTRASKKRIIEVMTYSGSKINFGSSIFKMGEKGLKKRVIFEHSAEVQMALLYEADNNRIVFDNLIPSDPLAEGMFEFYVPDGSSNAFVLENGSWVYQDDVDARRQKDKMDKYYSKPKTPDLTKTTRD